MGSREERIIQSERTQM